MYPKPVSFILRIFVTVFLMGCGGFPLSAFPVRFMSGKTYKYSYSTDTTINELKHSLSNRPKSDVGFRFTATVELSSVWASNGNEQHVIKLSIADLSLHGIARNHLSRELKLLPRLPIYFHWNKGLITEVYIVSGDPTVSVNIKKGIISLLQLRFDEGTHQEVDASGECTSKYTKTGDETITKAKTNCVNKDESGHLTQVNQLFGVNVTLSSQTHYTVFDDVIKSAVAHEKWISQVNLEESLALILSVNQQLTFAETVPSDVVEQSGPISKFVKKIEKEQKLYESRLGTVYEARQCTGQCASASDSVAKFHDDLLVTNIGKSSASIAFRELVRAFRGASQADILAILKDKKNDDIVYSLIDVASATQTSASQEALMNFLNFKHRDEISLPERYLLGTALTTHPREQLLLDLLKLFKEGSKNENLRESIGEALGAVTYTYSRMKGHNEKIVSDVQEAMLNKLDNCKEAPCQLMLIRAMANAGLSGTLNTLIKHAETSKVSTVSEAGVRALRRLDKELISSKARESLKGIFHQKKRGYDTAVRSQALSLILEINPTVDEVRDLVWESTDPWNSDYSLYIQSRIFNVAQQNEEFRSKVKEVLKDKKLNNYHILAPKGKALAFTSILASKSDPAQVDLCFDFDKPTTTYLMFVENSRSGIMKRSGMNIDITTPQQRLPLYSFEIFAAGLEGLIGDGKDDSDKDADVTAGMALDMVGVSLRPITFFVGQTGLMSAAWNAPSEPVSAFQANFFLQDHSERIRLQNGLIAELDIQGAVSLDLSGSLKISFWNKNSQSLVKNSGALFVGGSLSLDTSSFKSGIDFSDDIESYIDFQTDVDFYDVVKMCLQMSRPTVFFKQTITKYENDKSFAKKFTAKIRRMVTNQAMSYPLPGPNAAKCKLLIPS